MIIAVIVTVAVELGDAVKTEIVDAATYCTIVFCFKFYYPLFKYNGNAVKQNVFLSHDSSSQLKLLEFLRLNPQ